MGELDIRFLLRQLRLEPGDTADMEHRLMEMYREWYKAGQPRRTGKAGNLKIVGEDLEES